ncbi:MAG TPA: cytochrome c oxidase assembly protein [Solirubrobacteraceae bacterium]|jgi:cytochrome c oxidase assembly factor CtaG|nr:cytochrome c oxidase assembly protein [Solirubrobacteraceae bacterium]
MHVPGWSSWTVDPAVIAVLALAGGLYWRGFRRARALAAEGHRPGAGHWIPYLFGLLILAGALMSPIDAIGDDWLLSAHMFQHILLSDVAPALLVLGLRAPILPLGLPRSGLRLVAPGGRAGRIIRVLTSPFVALPLWAGATWLWAIPAVFDYSAAHPLVHAFEHATLFYTGLAMWWLIIDPLPSARREPGARRLAYLGFTRLASAVVCLPLTFMSVTAYPRYADAPRAFGLSAINDQRLAGAGMCFLEFLIFGIAMVAVFLSFLSRDEQRAAVEDRIAGRLTA